MVTGTVEHQMAELMELGEAWRILQRVVRPGGTETCVLSEALYRTLAEDVRTDSDQPPFDRSVMDGFVVRASDAVLAPVLLRVVGEVHAGGAVSRPLSAGEAMRINTGAPIPAGADAVVRVEDTEFGDEADRFSGVASLDENTNMRSVENPPTANTINTAQEQRHTGHANRDRTHVLIRVSVAPGNFITRKGVYRSRGDVVLAKGTRLSPLAVAVAASAGADRVKVYRVPRVAILSTGDELVDVGQVPGTGQIRDSNAHLLRALIISCHCEAMMLNRAADDRDALRRAICKGLDAEVLCLTGGVSMGTKDLVPEILTELGAGFHIRKLKIKPGRPAHVASMPDGTLVFALPGNPASVFTGFELIVQPVLRALQGGLFEVPSLFLAKLRGELKATGDRTSFVPAKAVVDADGQWVVEPLSWHGSGDAFGMGPANAWIQRFPNDSWVRSGEKVSVFLMRWE